VGFEVDITGQCLDVHHGRGLFLVESLSESFGTYRRDGYVGKVVWARLRET